MHGRFSVEIGTQDKCDFAAFKFGKFLNSLNSIKVFQT